MNPNIDFDDESIYLFNNKLYNRLAINGTIFFELVFDFHYCEFTTGAYIEILEDEWERLIVLPNVKEILLFYVNKIYSS